MHKTPAFTHTIKVLLVCLSLILSIGSNAEEKQLPEVKIAPIPDWVLPVQLPDSTKPQTAGRSVRYLLSDQQKDISGETARHFNHVAMQPVNEQGLERSAEIGISFNPQFETLTWHFIRVIRNGQISNRLDAKKLKIFSNESEMEKRQYNGRYTSLAILEDIRVGDIIEYAFSIDGTNPVLGDKRFGSFSTSWGVSLQQVNLRLVTRKNQYVKLSQNAHRKQTSDDNTTEYLWHFNNTPAIREEDAYPSWFNPYGFIEFSEYKNWREVIKWAKQLYQAQPLPADLKPRIEQWKKQYSSQQARIVAAIRFVQDEIRYFGIELGQNTHKPYSPAQMLERRFGDCKDKTVLLITLLNALGVDAYPALVSSYAGKALPQRLPSPGAFDHVITYLPYKGKDYWIDGTISHQRGDLNTMGVVDYKNALVIKPGARNLVAVNIDEKRKPVVKTVEEIEFLDDQFTARLTVTSTYSGIRADSLRYDLASAGKELVQKHHLDFYAQFFKTIKTDGDLEVFDNVKDNQLKLVSRYIVSDWTIIESGKRYIPIFAADLNDLLFKPKVRNRQHPFAIVNNLAFEQTQVVRLAKEKIIGLNTDSIDSETPYFSYHKKVQQTNDKIVVTHQFQPKRSFVDAKNTADYLSKVEEVSDQLGVNIILPGSSTTDLREQDKKLRSLAQRLLKKK